MNTKSTGNTSVGFVASALLKKGYVVLFPFGDNERYDLVIELNGQFSRVQVKTGRLESGSISFDTASTNLEHGKWVRHDYIGQIELFGVYCPQLDKTYLVPVQNCKTEMTLRVESPKNNAKKNIRWAKDFEF